MAEKELVVRNEKAGLAMYRTQSSTSFYEYTLSTLSGKVLFTGLGRIAESGIILHSPRGGGHNGFHRDARNYDVDANSVLRGLQDFDKFYETENYFTNDTNSLYIAVASAVGKDPSILDELTPEFIVSDENFIPLAFNRYIANQFYKYSACETKAILEKSDVKEGTQKVLDETKAGIKAIKESFERKMIEVDLEDVKETDNGLVQGPFNRYSESKFRDTVLGPEKG